MDQSLLRSSPPVAARIGAITTERLDLSPVESRSVEGLEPVFAKVEVWRYPYGRAFTRSETEAFVASQIEHWETLGFGLWVVSERGSDQDLGYVGLAVPTFLTEVLPAVEVGWRLDPAVWGKGYATEAAFASLTAAFDTLRLSKVISLPQTGNPPSVRVAERIGMRRERDMIAPATDKRGPVEVAVMAVTRDEWVSRSAES
jgi:RimJ/RimL family protein N-acetyltransferase